MDKFGQKWMKEAINGIEYDVFYFTSLNRQAIFY